MYTHTKVGCICIYDGQSCIISQLDTRTKKTQNTSDFHTQWLVIKICKFKEPWSFGEPRGQATKVDKDHTSSETWSSSTCQPGQTPHSTAVAGGEHEMDTVP